MSRPRRSAHCKFCARKQLRHKQLKVKDGPIDWFFCDVHCAELWLDNRHRPETYHLCRLLPTEKLAVLQGRSMSDEISRLTGK